MPSQYMAVVRSKLNRSRTEWSKVQTRTDRTQLATNEVNCRPDGYNTLYIQQFMPLAWPPTLFLPRNRNWSTKDNAEKKILSVWKCDRAKPVKISEKKREVKLLERVSKNSEKKN